MVDLFMERGFTYFDTAYPYHGGASEGAFRQAVVERYPRDSFTVTSKMPCWLINRQDDLERIFNEQLERCGVDYFDYYWLHALNPDYTRIMDEHDGWGFIARKQQEGRIRHIGFSFHGDTQLLERLLEQHPEVEYVQLQVNYLDWESPAVEAHTCYDICTRYGKPVIVMEPVWGGALANVGSYLVYFILLVAFIRWKIGVNPLSTKLLPVMTIVLALFGINWLWTIALAPWFSGFFAKPIFGLAINAALKSSLFLVLGMVALYKMKVSQSVNDLAGKALVFQAWFRKKS